MTKSKIKRNYLFQNLLIIIILCIITTMVIFPQSAITYFREGIIIWAKNILPALLPFFILSKLLCFTPIISKLGKTLSPVTQKLYGVGGIAGYVYIMSIISGYPTGAKITSDLYKSNTISSGQAHTISAFTSTSGPLFILGTVAIGFYKNITLGFIVLISHFLSAIINGFFYRNKNNPDTLIQKFEKPQNILEHTMKSSIESVLIIGGFIALFYMILQILISLKYFTFITYPLSLIGISPNISTSIISGIIEVTTGSMMLASTALPFNTKAIILSFLVSFGGLSIHAQAFTFLKDFNMPYSKFLLQKFSHAIISTIITLLIVICI